MDVVEATAAYERWLRRKLAAVAPDLRHKHACMDASLFQFFRATFYRWVPVWHHTCAGLAEAPELLAVADLHVENFASWRDRAGRLASPLHDTHNAPPLPPHTVPSPL